MSENWDPFPRDVSERQIDGVAAILRERGIDGAVVDLGCGDGRILVPLAVRGFSMIGIDEDPAAFAAARHRLSEKGLDAPLIRADFLAGMQETPHGLAGVLCLGNTFMCVADVRVAAALLREIHRALAPGGLFVIDDFPFECWREIADGNWQEGVSEDGTQQIVFVPGDAAIALRQGGGVDPKNWNIRAGERLLRLWSMGDLELLALTAGMSRPRRLERAGVICFTRSPAPGQ